VDSSKSAKIDDKERKQEPGDNTLHIGIPVESGAVKRKTAAVRNAIMKRRSGYYGQSLVEYALLIGLVALVVIVVIGTVGLGVQRIYGLIAGVLGARHDSSGGTHQVIITRAECSVVQTGTLGAGQTGIWIEGTASDPLENISGSTDSGGIGSVSAYGGGFVFNPLISSTTANPLICPKAIVIQSTSGGIAIAPLQVVVYPP